MLLTWCADIHLDHADPAAVETFLETLRKTAGRAVIVGGDVSTSRRVADELRGIAEAAARPVWFVLGNHDHFGGSVASTRDQVLALADDPLPLRWLPPEGVVDLGDGVALVGVDGWADGRAGNALGTPLRLNDDRLIAELAAQPDRSHRLAVRRTLADADAARLAGLLERVDESVRTIVVATHVPPFVEALPRRGHLATPDWWPLLICVATGDVLREAAAARPGTRFVVLAGHTHVATDVEILPNLRIITGAARYGAPTVRDLEVD